MADTRAETAIACLERHVETGDAAEVAKALVLVRNLDRDLRDEDPEARKRREFKKKAVQVQKDLAPAAAAYQHWQKKTGRAA